MLTFGRLDFLALGGAEGRFVRGEGSAFRFLGGRSTCDLNRAIPDFKSPGSPPVEFFNALLIYSTLSRRQVSRPDEIPRTIPTFQRTSAALFLSGHLAPDLPITS
jgi:hypothetical protein